MAPRSTDLEVILDDLRASVEAIFSVLTSGRESELGDSQNSGTLAEHRQLLDEVARLVSVNATKLAVSFSANPNAQEAQPLSDNFYQSTIALCGLLSTAPANAGETLLAMYRDGVVAVMEASVAFLAALKEGLRANRGQEQQRQTAGIVWDRCGAIEALPRDNRGAAGLRLRQQQELVDDAIRELAEEYEEYKSRDQESDDDDEDNDEEEDEDQWRASEAAKIPAVLGLCRASSKTLHKLRTSVVPLFDEDSHEHVALLGDLLDTAGQLSAYTDDLVAASYARQDPEALSDAAIELANAAETLLEKGKSGAGSGELDDSTEDALAFLSRAVTHNLDKLHHSPAAR